MGQTASAVYEKAKPDPNGDRLLGDGNGLFLRIRPHGTKTWVIEYELKGRRTKYTIGGYLRDGAPGETNADCLRYGQQSVAQARAIASDWKQARRAGRDPVAEWESALSQEQAIEAARLASLDAERQQPTVRQAIDAYMQKMMVGKKSAPAARYRLDRLAACLGDMKIRDVTRQKAIAALDTIAEGRREGKTAKHLCGEVLCRTKQLFRFAESREAVPITPWLRHGMRLATIRNRASCHWKVVTGSSKVVSSRHKVVSDLCRTYHPNWPYACPNPGSAWAKQPYVPSSVTCVGGKRCVAKSLPPCCTKT